MELTIHGSEYDITNLVSYLAMMSDVKIGQPAKDKDKIKLSLTVKGDCVQFAKYVADKYGCTARISL